MKNFLVLVSIIILMYGCSSKDKSGNKDRLNFKNDCESLDGWNNNTYPVSSENSHSGRYSNKINMQNPYSIIFRYRYGDLTRGKLKGIQMNLWTYYLSNNFQNGSFVVSVDLLGQSQFWAGIDLKEFVKSPKTWTKIEKTISFPKQYDPNSYICVYAWNDSDGTILVDDFDLKFLE